VSDPPLGLGYTILVCDDLAEMRAFYVDVLGLRVLEERADYVKLAAGPVFVALRAAGRAYDGQGPTAAGRVQLAFPVSGEAIDSWHQRLITAGAAVHEPPTDQSWGHRTLFAADPEGNLIEFYAEI